MADMQNKLNQTINQSINQWVGGGGKSPFKPVGLSKNAIGEIKIVLKGQIYQTEDRRLRDTGEEFKEAGDWGAALQCFTLHLIWKEIYWLCCCCWFTHKWKLTFNKAAQTYWCGRRRRLLMHISRVYFSLIYWVKAWVEPRWSWRAGNDRKRERIRLYSNRWNPLRP